MYLVHPCEIVYVHVQKRKPLKLVVIRLAELREQNQDVVSGRERTNSINTSTKQIRGRITQVRRTQNEF